jgi:hypothetical protein
MLMEFAHFLPSSSPVSINVAWAEEEKEEFSLLPHAARKKKSMMVLQEY